MPIPPSAERPIPTARLPRHFRRAICLALLALLLQGCAYRAWSAARIARRMADPDTSPRKSIILQQRLIELAPHSDEFLDHAFFPIGLYDVPESALEEVAAAGFNLVVNGDPENPYREKAEALGIRVIPYISHSKMERDVKRVHASQTILAWYLMDEPDLNHFPPAEYRRLARKLRRVDKTRPIYLTVWAPPRYADFMDRCDIFAPNPYPIRHIEPERNRLRVVGYVVDVARQVAGRRPVWAILQAFWAEPIWPRNPTPDELRAMAFIAFNHGAGGLIYFSYKSGDRPITEHKDLFAEITILNHRLHALRAFLLKPPIEGAVQSVALDRPPDPDEQRKSGPPDPPPLDCSLRAFRNTRLLIAVNPDPVAKRVRITVPGLAPSAKILQLAAQRGGDPLPLPPDGRLDLPFDPFQVRLFLID